MHYTFHIAGVPVYSRTLPSGDITIWHPYNEGIRAVVEPICRDRGYWHPVFKNWIVHRRFREAVLAALQAAEGHHV